MASASKSIHIGLVFAHHFAYDRGIIEGVRTFIDSRPEWLFSVIMAEDPVLHSFNRRRPDGLIVSADSAAVKDRLRMWKRPAVDVSAVFADVPFPRVRVDNLAVGRLAAEHLGELGLKHFAFVGPRGHLYADERRHGFVMGVNALGGRVDAFDVPLNPQDDLLAFGWNLRPSFLKWLGALHRPVGVFVPFDFWGTQVAEACRLQNLHIPQDVALLGVDNDELLCELTRPKLSSVVLPAYQIGIEAVRLLEQHVLHRRTTCEEWLLPPQGVEVRQSTSAVFVDDDDVRKSLSYIRERAHTDVQVADVCRHAAVGRRTLERRFRETVGRGIGEEIRRTHFVNACRLLTTTELPIQTVAQLSGFSDFRHMGNTFRQRWGGSPSDYRSEMRRAASHSSPR